MHLKIRVMHRSSGPPFRCIIDVMSYPLGSIVLGGGLRKYYSPQSSGGVLGHAPPENY